MIHRAPCQAQRAWNPAFNPALLNHSRSQGDEDRDFRLWPLPKALSAQAQQTCLGPVVQRPSATPCCSASNSKSSALGLPGASHCVNTGRTSLCLHQKFGRKTWLSNHLTHEECYSQNDELNQRLPELTDHPIHRRTFDSYRYPGGSDMVGFLATQFSK